LEQFLDKQALQVSKLREQWTTFYKRAFDIIASACESAYSASQEIGSLAQAAYILYVYINQFTKKTKEDERRNTKWPSDQVARVKRLSGKKMSINIHVWLQCNHVVDELRNSFAHAICKLCRLY